MKKPNFICYILYLYNIYIILILDLVMNNSEKLFKLFSLLDKEIKMEEFEDKLITQKITYLAQTFDIDLGYTFEWNKRGPYCAEVSEDAHATFDSSSQQSDFTSSDTAKIEIYKKKIMSHFDDHDWLEVAASIKYLRKEFYANKFTSYIDECLVKDLTVHYKSFPEKFVRKVMYELEKNNI